MYFEKNVFFVSILVAAGSKYEGLWNEFVVFVQITIYLQKMNLLQGKMISILEMKIF